MESIVQPEIIKQGFLGKLGGGAGGHKNWKDRYFVLSDHLYYYTDREASVACRSGAGGRRHSRAAQPQPATRAGPAFTVQHDRVARARREGRCHRARRSAGGRAGCLV